jgi:hypothetical protein
VSDAPEPTEIQKQWAELTATVAAARPTADRPWLAYVESLVARLQPPKAPPPRVVAAILGKILAALPKLVAVPVEASLPVSPAEGRGRLLEALHAEGIFPEETLPISALARELYAQARAALVAARDLAQALVTEADTAGPYNAGALAAEALREASRLSSLYVRALLAQLDAYRALAVLPAAPEPKALKGPGRAAPSTKKSAKKKTVDKAKSLKSQMRPGKNSVSARRSAGSENK